MTFALITVLVNPPVNTDYDPYRMHITDFGVCLVTQLVDNAGQIYIIPGCIEYMAPEIRSLARPEPTTQSDMWAVGVIGYELALGLAMDSTSPHFQPLENYFQGQELDFPQIIPQRFSPDVHNILRMCLNRDPDWRISALNLANRIQQILNTNEQPAPAVNVLAGGWI